MIRDARQVLKGDESKWQKAARIDRFTPIGNKKGKALFPTVLQFMHDNDNLYVRFFCADSAMRSISHGGELVQHNTLYSEAVHRPSGFVEINLK